MRTDRPPKRRWRIGELADAAGVTVRALHHYEDLGLLAPVERTDGGHRLYDAAAVERLYRIRALRGLGVPLDEIRRVVAGGAPLAEVVRSHLARVEADLERTTRLRDRLRGLVAADAPTADDLLATLDAMALVERHATTGDRGIAVGGDAEQGWRLVGEALRSCLAAGDAPSSPGARAAAIRARALIDAFARGDPAVREALALLRAAAPPRDLAGWDPDLTRYLDRALAALDEG